MGLGHFIFLLLFLLVIGGFGVYEMRRLILKKEIFIWLPRYGAIGPYKFDEDKAGFIMALSLNAFFTISAITGIIGLLIHQFS